MIGDHADVDELEAAIAQMAHRLAGGGLGGVADAMEEGDHRDEATELDAESAADEFAVHPGFVAVGVAHLVELEEAGDEFGGEPGLADAVFDGVTVDIGALAEDYFERLVEAELELGGEHVGLLLAGDFEFVEELHAAMGPAHPSDRTALAVEEVGHVADRVVPEDIERVATHAVGLYRHIRGG